MSITSAINDFCDRLAIEGADAPRRIVLPQAVFLRLVEEVQAGGVGVRVKVQGDGVSHLERMTA